MGDRLERAAGFIWGNARLLDRLLFAHAFCGEGSAPVLAALRAYQNADGGFGNALEPDKRTPHSQPVDVEVALRTLDGLGALGDPMVARVCGFLESVARDGGGVPFSLPSANAYPHAPWWAAPDDPPAAINPTAAIVGLLLKAGVRHPWLERAADYCWRTIAASDTTEFHDLMPIITFLEHAPDRPRAERELSRTLDRVASSGAVAMDVGATGYVHKPLDWAPAPESPCRRLFSDDVLREHLRALAAAQQGDGGWPISWEPISPAVACEWRGAVTVGALTTLRAYAAAGLDV